MGTVPAGGTFPACGRDRRSRSRPPVMGALWCCARESPPGAAEWRSTFRMVLHGEAGRLSTPIDRGRPASCGPAGPAWRRAHRRPRVRRRTGEQAVGAAQSAALARAENEASGALRPAYLWCSLGRGVRGGQEQAAGAVGLDRGGVRNAGRRFRNVQCCDQRRRRLTGSVAAAIPYDPPRPRLPGAGQPDLGRRNPSQRGRRLGIGMSSGLPARSHSS